MGGVPRNPFLLLLPFPCLFLDAKDSILTMPTKDDNTTLLVYHHAYTKGIGYIFLIAFFSYYVQYPSLSSEIGGIEPLFDTVFSRNNSTNNGGAYYHRSSSISKVFNHIVERGYIDVDGLVELINLFGVGISMLIAR